MGGCAAATEEDVATDPQPTAAATEQPAEQTGETSSAVTAEGWGGFGWGGAGIGGLGWGGLGWGGIGVEGFGWGGIGVEGLGWGGLGWGGLGFAPAVDFSPEQQEEEVSNTPE